MNKRQPTIEEIRKIEKYLKEKGIKLVKHDGEIGVVIELCPEEHPLREAAKKLWGD